MADPENQGGSAAVADAPQITQLVNEDNSFVENWPESLGEEFKEHIPTLSRFKNVPDLAKSFISTKKMTGYDPDDLIQIIKDDSPDEVKTAFWKAAGKPDAPEGYEFKKSKDISEKVEVVDAQIKAFTAIAHKYHLNNTQFNGVVNDYLKMVGGDIDVFDTAQAEQTEGKRLEGVAKLKKAFGSGLEDRTLRAEALMNKYGNQVIKTSDGDKTLLELLYDEAPQLKNSSYIRMIFDNVAESMSEDTLKGVTAVTTPTTSQVEAKINELRANPAYDDRAHPQHKDIVAQVRELYKKKVSV